MKKILLFVVMAMLISTQVFATVTFTNTITTGPFAVGGNSMETVGELNLAGTYTTNGFTFGADVCGVSHIQSLLIQGEDGYMFWYNASTGKVLVFQTATLTPAGSVSSTFTGVNATITPSAALAGAPVFTGANATISPTAASSALTFSGANETISPTAALAGAPVFSGANETISPTAALAGAPVFTGANATISPTATMTLRDNTPATGYAVYYDPATHDFNYYSGVPGTDNATIVVTGASYTPEGTVSTPAITVTGASYTPSGTVSTPAITVTGASYTPAGTINTPTITVTGASYTPEGTVSTPAITVTGASYTPAGTVASSFTGTPTTAAPLAEVGAGVSLAGVDKVNYTCVGW